MTLPAQAVLLWTVALVVTTLFLELRTFPRVVLLYISNILRRESVGLLGDGVEGNGYRVVDCYKQGNTYLLWGI
jgi:hypothetical protein